MPAAERHPDGGLYHGELPTTTVHVPHPPPGFVARPRLIRQLSTGVARGTVLVCGPAGYGKSSLLVDWARTERVPVAWLSVDDGDNDPARFWRHVALAVDTARPGAGDRIESVLDPAAPVTAPATALINEMAGASDELVLVVDDYHRIREGAVHRSVVLLLEHAPPSFRLVLATRADPPLPLARLRALGRLSELRAADLRFTVAEAAQLLRGTVVDLPDAAVAALDERTEGWGAGLALAALSMQGRHDVEEFVAAFSGSHRFVLDYLSEEVLDRQPEQTRAFLLETSVLDGLCGPLCDALRGSSGAQQQLEALERDNAFVHRLDDARHWWRYHHLFADLLRARLRREHPEREPELHRAAADWYQRHGFPDEAIHHALLAGEHEQAARLIEQHVEDRILRRNEAATLTRWMAELPEDVVDDRPRLSLARAVAALLGGRPDEAEPHLTRIDRTPAPVEDGPYEPSVGRESSILADVAAMSAICRADLARQRGDPEAQRDFARAAAARLTTEDTVLDAIARLHVAGPDWVDGRLAEAERSLDEVVRRLTGPTGSPGLRGHGQYAAARALYNLGGVQHARGRLGAAVRTYRHGLEVIGGASAPPAGIARVGLASVLYDRDELEAAEEHASEGVALARRLTYLPPVVDGLITLARIRQARGDAAGAAEAIGDAVDAQHGVVDLRHPVEAWAARLAVADGRSADAAAWVSRQGIEVDDEPSYRRKREYLVLARVLLADGDPERATALLHRWERPAREHDRTGDIVEIGVLLGLAHDGRGDRPAALSAVADALAVATPDRHLRVFLDEGAPMATLLRELLVGRRLEQLVGADAVPAEVLDHLSRGFARFEEPVLPPARPGAVAAPGLVEPLTAREAEVLALIADGRPNRDIAAELVITLDTVKRHVTHVLGKLAVTNRTEAVGRARRLGLVP